MAHQQIERHHRTEPGAAGDRRLQVELGEQGGSVCRLLLDRGGGVLQRSSRGTPTAAIGRDRPGIPGQSINQRLPDRAAGRALVQEQQRLAGALVAPAQLDAVEQQRPGYSTLPQRRLVNGSETMCGAWRPSSEPA